MGTVEPSRSTARGRRSVESGLMPKKTPATRKPVVRVLPLLGVAHLDRGFDYLVEEADSEDVQPGIKVRIRFNGRLVDAIVLERLHDSELAVTCALSSASSHRSRCIRRSLPGLSTP